MWLFNRGPVVPVLRLSGTIGMVTPLRPGLSIAALASPIEKAFAMSKAPSVAVVINSPGGSPVQSSLIFRRIRQLAEEKEKKVYGKIQHVDVSETIDASMAGAGKEIFETKCNACHKYDERYVGPALGKVTHRRTPEYVMNMILDTETMIENDDTVKCLMQEYLMRMPNQDVNEKG